MQELHALERRQPLTGVGGPLRHELADLDDPLLPQPRQVDHAAQRVQGLRRADVVCRLLAADVLLTGLEGEDEAAPPVHIAGLAGDPAGHATQMFLRGCEEAERWAAEVEAPAQRLALTERDVDAALAGGPQDAQGEWVHGRDRERPGLLRRRRQGLQVLNRAQE